MGIAIRTATTLRCEHCLRPVPARGACRRHPGGDVLDLSHPDDAAYAASVSTVRIDGRGRRWTTLGWAGVAALMAGFLLLVDPFGSIPSWVEDAGLGVMVGAACAVSLALGAHAVGALRGLPDALLARRHRVEERDAARDDPALRESTRDLDRARMLRAAALVGFIALCLLMSGNIGSVDVGHHDLRGLEGMPTTGLLAALTAIGGAAIFAIPTVLFGRWLLAALGRGPEQESMDATGLVDEAWDFDTLDFQLDAPGAGAAPAEREATAGPGPHRPQPPADVQPRSGWE